MNKNEPVLTVVTNAGKTLTFDYVEEFKVQSDYRYIQVEHPAHGGMFLQATGEQPTTGDWLDIHNQLIEEGCTVAIMDCIGEGENTWISMLPILDNLSV